MVVDEVGLEDFLLDELVVLRVGSLDEVLKDFGEIDMLNDPLHIIKKLHVPLRHLLLPLSPSSLDLNMFLQQELLQMI